MDIGPGMPKSKAAGDGRPPHTGSMPDLDPAQAEEILQELGGSLSQNPALPGASCIRRNSPASHAPDPQLPNLEARYRALVEQIPAVVFMAYLDRGIGEAYVSPQIEAALGFSQEEWLEDPVRWYSHIHPDDKQRWSTEAAEMFLTGKPLRSAYRVVARDGRVIWFHCEAKMIRKRGRRALVHSWRGIRHHRPEADRRSAAGRAQRSLRHSPHRRRSGRGARSGRQDHPLQPGLRTDHRLFLR